MKDGKVRERSRREGVNSCLYRYSEQKQFSCVLVIVV